MLNGNISEEESRTKNVFNGDINDGAGTSMSDKDRNQDHISDKNDIWDVSAGLKELESFLSADFHCNNVKANLAFVAAYISTKDEDNELKMFSTKLKLNETQKEAIEFLKDLDKDGIYDIDYKSIQPPQSKSKSTLNYWDSFKQEHRWIGKEQKNLEKWQRKWTRKLAKECQKKAIERGKSDELLKTKEETTAKKGAAKVAGIIEEFWKNIAKVAHFYELKLREDVEQKRLESQLMNVIDRSSTLTQLMIPGSKKKNAELEGLSQDPEDLDSLLASLPPEYLAAISANVDFEEKIEHVSLSEVIPRRPSPIKSPNKISTNGFKEADLPLKDTNGFGEKRKANNRLSLSPPKAKKSKLVDDDDVETPMDTDIPSNETTDESLNQPLQAQASATSLHDEEMNDLAKVAESFRPTGSTYETAKVRTEVPSILFATLREYQHIGLDWLSSLFENKLNGILADEMGLGKTVQTISFLAHLAENKKIWGPSLIVVPTSVLLNWEREFKRFCPSLKVLTYFGSTKERQEKRKGWKKPNSFNICITSYDLYIRDSRMFKWRAWQCLVLDEAHNIKNSKSLRWNKLLSLRTRIRLLLTGTPLQNNLMELWSLLYFLMPSVFSSQDDFKNWFNDPMSAMAEGAAEYNSQIVDKLHTVLRPFILRRLKCEVEKQMPLKLERVIFCPLARIQRNMYNQFIRQKETIDTLRGGSAISVMNIVMQLRKCCNHPNLFYPITCTAPTALPKLSLPYPNIINEIEEKDETTILLRLLKSDFIDENNNLLPLIASMFFQPKEKELFQRSVYPKSGLEKFKLTKVKTIKKYDFDEPSKKMQWLWNITKSVRDEIYGRHDALEINLYEPVERHFNNIHCKFVRKYSFPTSPVYAFYPSCSLLPSNNPIQEIVCDKILEDEDPLVSDIHYAGLIQYPDPKLVELDCGKLRMLAKLLRELKQGGHRCLIFTQMSKMLDILEVFLSHQKYPYFRLDGSTQIQQRQVLMDRFNADPRVFAFILSTRSGGIGMNLTGADTVIFYDSDWNPTMDAQAQDRCHRIGQTRNVVIYRLISSHTIEENILKKATHKRRLGEMALDEGDFNSKFVEKNNVRELFEGEEALKGIIDNCEVSLNVKDMEKVMYNVEDAADVAAAQELKKEIGDEEETEAAPEDFKEAILSQLPPVQRRAFITYLDEQMPEINERLKREFDL